MRAVVVANAIHAKKRPTNAIVAFALAAWLTTIALWIAGRISVTRSSSNLSVLQQKWAAFPLGSDLSAAPPVPCLGVVVGADPKLFLLRLVYSLDHPIHRFVVAYGGNETSVAMELDHIHSSQLLNLTAIHMGPWPGVAQGWNAVLRHCADVPWSMIVNVDAEFTAGSLAAFSDAFTADVAQQVADMGHPVCINIGDGNSSCGFTAVAVSRRTVDTIGLFDENIFPAYFEDLDYWRRFVASGLPAKAYPESRVWHSWHHKSQSGSMFLARDSSRVTFAAIQATTGKFTVPYLADKWGCNSSNFEFSKCTYQAPWGSESLRYWVPPTEEMQQEKCRFLFAQSAAMQRRR